MSKQSHRLFLPIKDISTGSRIIIEGEPLHYIKNILRLGKDDTIIIFNNTESNFSARIERFSKTEATLIVWDVFPAENESSVYTILLQGIPKSDKLEWVIQKTTELGVNEIIPVVSQHSIKKLSDNKITRFQKIAEEASRQSNRSFVPRVSSPQTLREYLERHGTKLQHALKILFCQEGSETLREILQNRLEKEPILLAVGPEGDFSKEEKDLFQKNGFQSIALGGRILRTETAAIATMGIIQYETCNLQ